MFGLCEQDCHLGPKDVGLRYARQKKDSLFFNLWIWHVDVQHTVINSNHNRSKYEMNSFLQ